MCSHAVTCLESQSLVSRTNIDASNSNLRYSDKYWKIFQPWPTCFTCPPNCHWQCLAYLDTLYFLCKVLLVSYYDIFVIYSWLIVTNTKVYMKVAKFTQFNKTSAHKNVFWYNNPMMTSQHAKLFLSTPQRIYNNKMYVNIPHNLG